MEEEQDERNVMPSSPHGAERPECSNYYVRNKLLSSLNHMLHMLFHCMLISSIKKILRYYFLYFINDEKKKLLKMKGKTLRQLRSLFGKRLWIGLTG